MDCDCEIGRGKKMARPENGSRKIPVHCDSCQARIDGLCEGCAPEVLRVIASHKTGDRKIKAGQDLFSPGEPCGRSEEHTSELQSLMRISYAVFCLKKKTQK